MDNGIISSQKPRIGVLDSLRGFAVASIFLIHTSNHFLFDSFPSEASALDGWIRSALYFLFEGKAYTIFALLFGFTFALQMDNYSSRRGLDFGGRMVWRMLILVLIGLLNCALFAGGDPLVFYALAMILVVPFRHLSRGWLLGISVLFLLQPFELLSSVYGWMGESYIDSYGSLHEVLVRGNAIDTFWAGMTLGLKGCLTWAVETGRFTQTIGLFLLGIWAYRSNCFAESAQWSRRWWLYILIAILLWVLSRTLFGFFEVYYNLVFTLSLAALFITLYQRFSGGWLFVQLGYYGRMSLTNFVTQSLLGALLYYPWALDLGEYLGVSWSVLITLGLIVLQIALSRWWLRSHKRGVFESLWHKLTYIK